jgi:hypothetical protein
VAFFKAVAAVVEVIASLVGAVATLKVTAVAVERARMGLKKTLLLFFTFGIRPLKFYVPTRTLNCLIGVKLNESVKKAYFQRP